MAQRRIGVVTVVRPEPTIWERTYLVPILKGLVITFRHMIRSMFYEPAYAEEGPGAIIDAKGVITQQYPEVPTRTAENYRGVPVLVKNQEGKVKCVSCQLCEFICPPRAISIRPAAITPEVAGQYTNKEKYPQEFTIDMLRCIYCGYCEEVCPEQAIFLSQEYSLSAPTREDLIFDKEKLLELGGVRLDVIRKWEHQADGRNETGRSGHGD
jgi:NADH-quinone oxidoreductase subunit I